MPKGIPRWRTHTLKSHLPRRDDLPFLKASAARKAGIINPTMTHATIEVGGLKRTVGLWHMRFPKTGNGSWSFFICPCGRRCMTLRLYDGRLACCKCDGLMSRAQSGDSPDTRTYGDKAPRIERLRSLLAKPKLRFTRRRPETALRRAIIVQRRRKLKGWPPKP